MIHQRTAPAATRVKGNADADGTYRYFYSDQWQILEVRDGSDLSRQQWVYGTQYVDELVLMDYNVDLQDNDCDPDKGTVAEESFLNDNRYFYHQDRNWNVVAITTIGDDLQHVNGHVVERYAYTPYGERTVLAGAAVRGASSAGNPFGHQGLPVDMEKESYQNRWREYLWANLRYQSRDRAGFVNGLNDFHSRGNKPTYVLDPLGLHYWDRPSGCICRLVNSCANACASGRLGMTFCHPFNLYPPCVCICDENIRANWPQGQPIIEQCVRAHERSHADTWCDNDECAAYEIEGSCLGLRMQYPVTPCNCGCLQDLAQYATDGISRCTGNCGTSPQQCKSKWCGALLGIYGRANSGGCAGAATAAFSAMLWNNCSWD